MTATVETVRFVLLQARGQGARSNEALNAGAVLFTREGVHVVAVQEARRLAALHPDFTAVALEGWSAAVEQAVNAHFRPDQDLTHVLAFLPLVCSPFEVCDQVGVTEMTGDVQETAKRLMEWYVSTPKRTLPHRRPETAKRATRLHHEIRKWLQGARAFSTRVDDLRKGKVVANYPIDPAADLYADFAVMNGKLNAIETLDLRGVDRLTPTMRGDAAVKGITLDEARERIDGRRLVVISATDYGIARPAIQLVSRYADDVLDMQVLRDRERLATFISDALHRQELPELHFQQ